MVTRPTGDNDFIPYAAIVPTLPGVTTTTKTLSYTDSQWGDLLTSYDGTTITYDGIGNPLSYYNGSAYTFTWEGRQLVGVTKGSNILTFVYNDEGLRTSKTVNGVTHTYYLNGNQIVAEEWGDKLLVYLYDSSGSPIGMMFRKTSYELDQWDVYWFEKNLQGDIVAVYNSNGQQEAYYTYTDAWGNHSAYTTTGATEGARYNPFRYRGYYYDTDLGMYYLQSRYYDPHTCRFINADDILYLGASGDLISLNLYAYCSNNPVIGYDPYGHWDWKAFGLNCIKAAIATSSVAFAVLVIGSSLGGTVMSGGAGAVSIPAAVAIASQALVASSVIIASIGVVSVAVSQASATSSHLIGENGTQTPSKKTWNGEGQERLEVENPAPGRRDGQIHYHESNNEKHMFDFTTGSFKNPTKRLKELMTDNSFLRGLKKAFEVLGVR